MQYVVYNICIFLVWYGWYVVHEMEYVVYTTRRRVYLSQLN
jgi:hypothetical protein